MGLAFVRLEGLAIRVYIIKAATVPGWHRKGFRLFWTWKIRRAEDFRHKRFVDTLKQWLTGRKTWN
jgi:hypothetical protein